MRERLPIPLKLQSGLYHSVEIDAPTAGVFADTRKVADTGDRYSATLVFLTGCISSIVGDGGEITDKLAIKSAVRQMAFRSAEVLSLRAILQVHDDDGIEGVYECPRCNSKVMAQIVEEAGEVISDTRDFIGSLDIAYMGQEEENIIKINLKNPCELINTKSGETLVDMKTGEAVMMLDFEMTHPTIGHCIEAQTKQGLSDEMRLQYRIYVEAIKKVNGTEVDRVWKDKYGMLLFDKIKDISDLKMMSEEVHRYGIDRRITKHCTKCGKEWRALVNTSNFFASGLLSM